MNIMKYNHNQRRRRHQRIFIKNIFIYMRMHSLQYVNFLRAYIRGQWEFGNHPELCSIKMNIRIEDYDGSDEIGFIKMFENVRKDILN